MLRTVLAGLKARPLRLLLSAVAVTLGVTFVAGSFVLTDSVGAGLREAVAFETRGVDVSITAKRGALDDATLAKARQVPGVAAAEGRATVGAPVIGPDGRPRDAAATALSADEGLRPYDLAEGRFPHGPGEIAMERNSAEGFPLGGPVTVLDETGGRHPLTLVGTFSRPSDAGLGGANLVVSQETLRRLSPAATFGEIVVRAAPGVGQARLAAELKKALGVPAITGKEAAARLLAETAPNTAGLAKFFTGFAVLAMVVAAMVITNSFTILVTQRARELALLRCVGAGKRQLFVGVLAEATVVGAIASVAGLFGGLGAAAAVQAIAGQETVHLPLTARTVAAAVAIGVLVTALAAAIPAWAATRVAPVEALRTPAGATRAGRRRVIVAGLLLAAAASSGTVALRSSVDDGAGLALVAMVALLGATLAAGPLIAGPVVRTLGRLVPGKAAGLGALNADRDPKRTAASAAALTIGLTVVALATTMAAGVEAGRSRGLDEQLAADFTVTSVLTTRPLPATLAGTVAAVPGVTATATRWSFSGDLGEYGKFQLTAVSGDLLRPKVLSGRLDRLGPGEIAIGKDLAEQTGLAVGDTVRSLRVVAVYDAVEAPGADLGFALVDVTEQRRLDLTGETYDGSVLVKVTDPDRDRPALERALSASPLAKLSSVGEIKEEEAAPLRETLNLLWALTGLAVLIAFAGITNTLSLSVLERTRESALLRALGLTRGGLGAALTAESVFVAVLGTVCGLSVGIASAWLITEVASGGGEAIVFAPPWGRLGVLVAAALVAAPLAAFVPARRAGRASLVAGLSAV